MARTKKRSKPYRPTDPACVKLKAQPWKVAAIFNPMLSILDQLEQQGTVDETTSGQAVMRTLEGEWFDTAAALDGVTETYEIHERRTGCDLGLDPLRQLANKLRYGVVVFDSDTKACRECLVRVRAATLEMTAGYAEQLLNDFQIKDELMKEAA